MVTVRKWLASVQGSRHQDGAGGTTEHRSVVPLARKWVAFLSASVLLGLSLTGLAAATMKDPRTRYIETYESISGSQMTYTELQLPTIGQMNCDSLEDGYSLPDVYSDNIITGLSGDQSAYTIEAAITVYCPQFKHLLD